MSPLAIAKKLCPRAKPSYLEAIAKGGALFTAHGITTPLRMAHFLAQCFHETGGLFYERESGAYSAAALTKTFGVGKHSAGITAAEARALANNGPAIFERVYGFGNPAKAKELGNIQPGDGWRYRGGGIMQTTGRYNYRVIGQKVGVDFETNPELVVSPEHALKPALAEWTKGKLNRFADADNILAISRAINLGNSSSKRKPNGLEDRQAWLRKIKPLVEDFELEPPPAEVPHGEQSDEIYSVQKRLDALGYHEVGTADGKWGGKTAAAIAAFKNDRHLDGEPVIDAALLSELERAEQEGFKRAIAPTRAEATEATVTKEAPEIVPVKRSRLAALWATIVSAFLAVVNAVGDYFQDALGWLGGIKEHAAGAPAWLWFVVAFVVSIVIWLSAKNGANGIVEAFRQGKRS